MTDDRSSVDRAARDQTQLAGQQAIELWQLGKAAWNTWAQAHKGWTVSFAGVDFASHVPRSNAGAIAFAGFEFPGPTIFRGARFVGLPVRFTAAKFHNGYTDFTFCEFGNEDVSFFETDFGQGSVRFDSSTFGSGYISFGRSIIGWNSDASFNHVTFNGPLSFSGAQFHSLNAVSFRGSTFNKDVAFSDVTAATVIDLRGTRIAHAVNLDNCKIGLVRHRQGIFLVARNPEDASCFRRLKHLAIESKNHLVEQDFFRKEQLAARFREIHGVALIPGFLYEWLSDFGRSILRPTLFLIALLLASACFYYSMGNAASRTVQAATLLSLGQLLGVASWSSEAKTGGLVALFGQLSSVPFSVQVVALVQGVLSVVCLFLIGLGFRNRFRI